MNPYHAERPEPIWDIDPHPGSEAGVACRQGSGGCAAEHKAGAGCSCKRLFQPGGGQEGGQGHPWEAAASPHHRLLGKG